MNTIIIKKKKTNYSYTLKVLNVPNVKIYNCVLIQLFKAMQLIQLFKAMQLHNYNKINYN
jgi:hypothetical protein